MTAVDFLAWVLLGEVILMLPAAAYVTGVYLQSRRHTGTLPTLYTLIAALCIAIALSGTAIAAVVTSVILRDPVEGGLVVVAASLVLLLAVPILVAEVIRRIRSRGEG
jgi:hypothetical protein